MTEAASVRNEIEKSRRDVLDLTLRNPLLNFRPTKRRGIEVVDERSRELFRILVRSERVMYFLPAAEGQAPAAQAHTSPDATDDPLDDIPPELLALLAEPAADPDETADDPDETAAHHTDNKLQTPLTLASLNLRLRETFPAGPPLHRGTGRQHPLPRSRDAQVVRVRQQHH